MSDNGNSNYNYFKHIKTPSELGMSTDGDSIATNISALFGYVDLLTLGKSTASKAGGGPLGNKYFLNSGATCKAADTGESVPRYIYFNNIPDGRISIPGTGETLEFKNQEGLIPGIFEDLSRLNPMNLFKSFTIGDNPSCYKVTLPVGNAGEYGVSQPNCNEENKHCDTRYMIQADIDNIPDSWFSPQYPKPDMSKKEGFAILNKRDEEIDAIVLLYYSSLGLLGLYILSRFYDKVYCKK